ncbi:MAG: peptidoglycan-binding protein [Streptomyces sp.]|nr:peptidoglycan-binding protein [Streptomyces sp.]NUT24801.1 peptidoglycan-binding protein [Streptomyces sp.]
MDDFRAGVARILKGDDSSKPKPDPIPKPDPKPKPRPQPKPKRASKPRPKYASWPGRAFFHAGRASPVIEAMAKRLATEGCDLYDNPPGPVWNEAHRRPSAAWQIECGFRGADADGGPGARDLGQAASPASGPLEPVT